MKKASLEPRNCSWASMRDELPHLSESRRESIEKEHNKPKWHWLFRWGSKYIDNTSFVAERK